MCVYAAKHSLEKPFRLFLLLKLVCQEGKTKFTDKELNLLAELLGYSDTREIKKQLLKLQQIRWVRLNQATGFYHIKSYNKIAVKDTMTSKASAKCYLSDLQNISAFIGAAIFTRLYKVIQWRIKMGKVVRLKGRTYHSFPSFISSAKRFLPVATTGIKALYGISINKASILKHQAENIGYIEVKKDLDIKELPKAQINLARKYMPEGEKLLIREGKVCFRLIDLILPQFALCKRRKLKTYTGVSSSNKHFYYKLNKS